VWVTVTSNTTLHSYQSIDLEGKDSAHTFFCLCLAWGCHQRCLSDVAWGSSMAGEEAEGPGTPITYCAVLMVLPEDPTLSVL
jgi:hypothetical protein